MRAHRCHLANTITLAHSSPQPKLQTDRFSRFRRAHGRVPSGTLAPPGEYDSTCAHWRQLTHMIELVLPSFGPTESTNRTASPLVKTFFAQLTAESPYSLQGAPLSPKISHSHMGTWQLTYDSLGPPNPQPKQHRFSGLCTHDRIVSDIAIFVLKRDVKLQLTN